MIKYGLNTDQMVIKYESNIDQVRLKYWSHRLRSGYPQKWLFVTSSL